MKYCSNPNALISCISNTVAVITVYVTLILSETEAVLTLLGKRLLSSRKLLDSSKLEPKLESEQEIQRDLRLGRKLSKLLGDWFVKLSGDLVMDTWGMNAWGRVEVAIILRS